jgi:hypothetical protein
MIDAEKSKIPEEHMLEIRRLVHDLSNALEIIVQTNYLLGMADVSEDARQWIKMMDTGVQQTTNISRELRQYVIQHGEAK